jgi:hypothetical protein
MKRIRAWLAVAMRLAADRIDPAATLSQDEAIKRFEKWASKPLFRQDGKDIVFIGEPHKILPSDFGLIESLRQRGYEVAFQEVPESR